MLDTLREAQKHFQEIYALLTQNSAHDNDYFTQLSIATEEAYVLMNEGMCASNSVCHECAEHRDFIRSILDVLSKLELDSSTKDHYKEVLSEYASRVNSILKNIADALKM